MRGSDDGFCSPSYKIQRWSLRGGVIVLGRGHCRGLGAFLKPAGRVTQGGGGGSGRRLVLEDWFVMNNLIFLKFPSVHWVPSAS